MLLWIGLSPAAIRVKFPFRIVRTPLRDTRSNLLSICLMVGAPVAGAFGPLLLSLRAVLPIRAIPMAKLTAKGRKRMKSSSFALPGKRKYPINDRAHARNALARVSAHGTAAEKKRVRAAVKRKFPSIGKKPRPSCSGRHNCISRSHASSSGKRWPRSINGP
jgi:hypothetical protein